VNLRHLRCFITLAEELHFGRAADRLHIEQSPLSRMIKRLESELDVRLLERTPRSTRLTWAGQVFLQDARRILQLAEQAKDNVRAAATGFRGVLRIALSDGIAQSRLTALLALCREEEPDVEIRLFETTLAQQVMGLRNDLYDAGLTMFDGEVEQLISEPIWQDSIVLALPQRHPLLAHRYVALRNALDYPLVLCSAETCEGCSRQIERLLHSADVEPIVAERVSAHDLMLALVAAGYGLGFVSAAYAAAFRHPEVVTRPLSGPPVELTTFLLRPNHAPSAQMSAFLSRATRIGAKRFDVPE